MGSTPVEGRELKEAGREKEKVSCDVGPRTASADPTGNPGDRKFLQSSPKPG